VTPNPIIPDPKKPKGRYKNETIVTGRTNLATIARSALMNGGTIVDVGIILGCQGVKGSEEWLESLKAEGLTVEEFIEAAKKHADVELIQAAARAALGYEYEETTLTSNAVYADRDPKTSEAVCSGYAPARKKIVKRRVPENSALLWHLLHSRMPEYFTDTKRIEIDKRVVEIKADAEAEIRSFASGLLKAFGEPVDAEFVEKVE